MNYVKLIFDLKNFDDADIISALLTDMNVQGFEQTENKLFAFFNETDFDEVNINDIVKSFSYSKEIIPHENWNATWESNFEPIRINNEVGVRADFHSPFTDCNYDIVITPKMSFGTGHHETTQMMLEYECDIDFNKMAVLDFGCGTGVLAIFSFLKGANSVMGIDNDNWSIENAKENCKKNQCDAIEISDQAIQTIDTTFDIILANINLNVLLESLPKMKQLLNENGHIFLSGILVSDIPQMTECFTGLGFRLISQKQKKEWVALHLN